MSPFTEEAEGLLFSGKYSKWARGIDAETLHVLFWFIGELACRSDARDFINAYYNNNVARVRTDIAMEAIIRIYRGERFSGAPIETPRQVFYEALNRRRDLGQRDNAE